MRKIILDSLYMIAEVRAKYPVIFFCKISWKVRIWTQIVATSNDKF